MHDDGMVERRVRLLRPMERPTIAISDLAHTHWQEAERAEFASAWEAEIAAVPELTDSVLHIVTGLLLPIWKRLPGESVRVYRLETDAGERIIGRLVSPAWVAQAMESEAPTLAPDEAFAAVLDGRTVLQLQDELTLRRARVMGEFRIELSDFTDGMVDRLKAIGLVSEIISWKLRLFVPVGTSGPSILARLMERHPLVRIANKAA
jgi:protein strawberry notch